MCYSTAVSGVLAVACGFLLTFPGAYCDEFNDENRPYEFGFNIEGQQHRHEKKDTKGIIKGEFGFITADGIYHVTVYATDENGDFKILSMKNIRVSPPLDGSAPYNPSLNGSSGSSQQRSSQPVDSLLSGGVPLNIDKYSSITVPPVTQSVKVFTGCSGCKVPVINLPQEPENFPESQPQRPLDLRKPYTTYSSLLAQKEKSNASPRINQSTNITGSQVTGVEAPAMISGRKGSSVVSIEASFPGSENFKSKEIFTTTTINMKNALPLFQTADITDQQTSTTSPFSDGQHTIPISPAIFYDQGQQTKPNELQKERHPSEENKPNTGQQFYYETSPPTVTVATQYFTSITKSNVILKDLATPVRNNINNEVTLRNIQQQNTLLSQTDKKTVDTERDGPPPGFTEDDIKAILYKFNYTVGFHGHHESGYINGNKLGGYYFNGRDGLGRNVLYVANEFGYQPNITIVDLGLDSNDTPKEETEKQFALKGYEFQWFYRR